MLHAHAVFIFHPKSKNCVRKYLFYTCSIVSTLHRVSGKLLWILCVSIFKASIFFHARRLIEEIPATNCIHLLWISPEKRPYLRTSVLWNSLLIFQSPGLQIRWPGNNCLWRFSKEISSNISESQNLSSLAGQCRLILRMSRVFNKLAEVIDINSVHCKHGMWTKQECALY